MTQNKKKPLGYLGGDIMTKGSNLARQQEYDTFIKLDLDVDVYSPIMNKSINDKASMTEEENNHLAEKITDADIERLWNSEFVVMCPEQSAIGSMCETGTLYGWKYMAKKLCNIIYSGLIAKKDHTAILGELIDEIERIEEKDIHYHYFDIRTNHLNEKDWRRSFSINQLLYGMILYSSSAGDFEEFDQIMKHLNKKYGKKEEETHE